jgi:hypothetical protein
MIPAGTDVLSIKGRNQRNTDVLSGKRGSQGKVVEKDGVRKKQVYSVW